MFRFMYFTLKHEVHAPGGSGRILRFSAGGARLKAIEAVACNGGRTVAGRWQGAREAAKTAMERCRRWGQEYKNACT